MEKRNKSFFYALSFVMLAACCGGALYGTMPFGAAMYCAFAASLSRKEPRAGAVKLAALSVEYILFSYAFSLDIMRLFAAGAAVFIMSVRWLISLKAAGLDSSPARYAFSSFAVIACGAIAGATGSSAMVAVAETFIGGAFLCFAFPVAACVNKKFASRLSPPEAISMCMTFAVAGLACGRAAVGYVEIGFGTAFLVALVLSLVGMKSLLSGGVSVALGMAAHAPVHALAFIGGVAAIAAFRAMPRPVYAVCGAGSAAAFAVLFGASAMSAGFIAASATAGAFVFSLVPKKTAARIREYFDFDGTTRLAVRHYINRVKADAGNRLLTLSSVFDETARLMGLFGESAPDASATGKAIADGICPYCVKRATCDAQKAARAFTAVAESAHAGRAVLAELPEFFTSDCAHVPDILSAASALSVKAREKKQRTESDDKAREIVTERLAAVKDVLEELGTAEALPVGFDGAVENKIKTELDMRGAECAEAFVSGGNVTAVVRTDGADRDKLRRAVSCCMKSKYVLHSLEKTQAAGWSVATFKKRPKYEAVYARAGVSKSGISGDSYTFERIGDRFLVALLDGMGTGSEAGKSSDAAIELIERFYKAGFDSEAALSGVNRFLKLPGGERFSAADVAVCDLDTAAVDIIKLGAPPCFIKTADTVLKIEGGSLPIGVLDEMRPYVTAKRLHPGQMLVMVTDGVSDCFNGDGLPMFINELKALNPERTAEAILERALKSCGEQPKDDMTVVAFRLFEERNRALLSA